MPSLGPTGLTMVTGPAWSGKTTFATSVIQTPGPVLWIGTGSRLDPQFSQHIDRIAALRPQNWQTIEASHELIKTLQSVPYGSPPIVIDSLNQWIANLVAQDSPKYSPTQLIDHLLNEATAFTDVLRKQAKNRAIVVVTAEVGWSAAPESPIVAALRRVLGTVNQDIARHADNVYLMCCGIGQLLKP